MSPRNFDIDAIVTSRAMPYQPYAGTYNFCYSQVWTADQYVRDQFCGSEEKLAQQWVPEQKVRTVYFWDFGGSVGWRRVLEYCSGNDKLWEITAFAEGLGYIAYRQWSIQGTDDGNFPPQSGRTIVWAASGAPIDGVQCCYGGPWGV